MHTRPVRSSEQAGFGGALRLELFVADVERSVEFYQWALGFTVERRSPGYASLRRGNAIVGIGAASGLPADHYFDASALGGWRGAGVEIVLEVGDLEAAFQAAQAAGARVLSSPAMRPWGIRDFRLADPDGYYIRVTTPG
jgi:catechol 2,3-dioxygenase-like lactoylglutathione lyase family enzyme